MSPAELPGVADQTGADEAPQVIAHVDMDCFYAACERLKEPALVGEPVVVGMGYDRGEPQGAVATASYEAREFGVESAMPISQALELLPRQADVEAAPPDGGAGYYRPVDMSYYKGVGKQVKEILHASAETVREVSIDEAYLDIGHVGWGQAAPERFGARLRERIQESVGITASVGIAPNMSAAKIASDHDKPDGLVVVPPGSVRSFLAELPIDELHGVGPVTARRLRELGLDTVGALAAHDREALVEGFGERGRELYDRARGRDGRTVTPQGDPKSVSRESAFGEPTADFEAKEAKLRELAADVADRAASKGALYRTIGIKIVEPPFDINTRARSLGGPVEDPALVESVALELLEEFATTPTRKIGVRVSNLEFAENDQSALAEYGEPGSGNGPVGRSARPAIGTRAREVQTTLRDFLDIGEPPSNG